MKSLIGVFSLLLVLTGCGGGGGSGGNNSTTQPEGFQVKLISPANYRFNGNLALDRDLYVDDSFVVTTLPQNSDGTSAINDMRLLQTANADRAKRGGNFIKFSVNRETYIVVGYHSVDGFTPGWLSSWESLGHVVEAVRGNDVVYYSLFQKKFGQNMQTTEVDLPANESDGQNNMYFVGVQRSRVAELNISGEDFIAVDDLNVPVIVDTQETIDVLKNDKGQITRLVALSTGGPENGAVAVTDSFGLATGNGRYMTYTPNPGFVGRDKFSYKIERLNSAGIVIAMDVADVTVEVGCENGNCGPTPQEELIANDDFARFSNDQPRIVDVLLNDSIPEGALTESILSIGNGVNAEFVLEGGKKQLRVTAINNFVGSTQVAYQLEVQLSDVRLTSSALVTLEVENGAPEIDVIATNDEYDVTLGASQVLDVTSNDNQGDLPNRITLVGSLPTEQGTAVVSGLNINYTAPQSTTLSEIRFSYRAEYVDSRYGVLDSEIAEVVINLECPQGQSCGPGELVSPVAVDDSAGMDPYLTEPQMIRLDITQNDSGSFNYIDLVDGTTTSNGGQLTVVGMMVEYRPAQDFIGLDTFSYAIGYRDEFNNTIEYSNVATVSIDVNCVSSCNDILPTDITLSWTAPNQRVNGVELTVDEIYGYGIYGKSVQGTSGYSSVVPRENMTTDLLLGAGNVHPEYSVILNSAELIPLIPNFSGYSLCFVMTTFDTGFRESAQSNEVCKALNRAN